jgi:hypothetical protein
MYIKVEEVKGLLVHSSLSDQDLRQRLIGMLDPIKTYSKEQVNQEQTAESQGTNEETVAAESSEQSQSTERPDVFSILDDVMSDMIKKGDFPLLGNGFADFLKRRHGSRKVITLRYDKDEAAKLMSSKLQARDTITEDFKREFEAMFNGRPSPDIIDGVRESAVKNYEAYRADNPINRKGVIIHMHLPPGIGKCNCPACTITPLN